MADLIRLACLVVVILAGGVALARALNGGVAPRPMPACRNCGERHGTDWMDRDRRIGRWR